MTAVYSVAYSILQTVTVKIDMTAKRREARKDEEKTSFFQNIFFESSISLFVVMTLDKILSTARLLAFTLISFLCLLLFLLVDVCFAEVILLAGHKCDDFFCSYISITHR